MKNGYLRLVASRALTLLLALSAGIAGAAPNPLPLNSNAYGKGYAELTADWLEWALAIPAATNPLLDSDGAFAALGQSGKVWFLAGTLGGPPAARTVTVPSGTALFFPVVNYFWVNTPEFGDPAWSPEQEAAVREFLAANIDTASGLALEIDGRSVPNVNGFRLSGAVGECTMPDDNIFGVDFDPGPHECVADGYWALLPPLSAGNHVIHFTGGVTGFSLDVTYHIAARGR